MPIRIFCIDAVAPYPRPVALELTCDGEHGLFQPEPARFDDAAGFISQHADAMKGGWLERADGRRGRIFLGPCCSGKRFKDD